MRRFNLFFTGRQYAIFFIETSVIFAGIALMLISNLPTIH
jgi:hypothetical protein